MGGNLRCETVRCDCCWKRDNAICRACCDMACVVMQVLTALQRLVNVLGPDSAACHPLLLPLLRYCTDIAQARRMGPTQPEETRSLHFLNQM